MDILFTLSTSDPKIVVQIFKYYFEMLFFSSVIILTSLELSILKSKLYIPCVLQGFLATQSFIHINTHQLTDEFLGIVADLVPVRRVKFKFT